MFMTLNEEVTKFQEKNIG